jgi:AcrR family transcriptional regulator
MVMPESKNNIKERILKASTKLFAAKGFDGVSIDELAGEAKINKSMIYYYFSSKEGLLSSLINRHLNEFEALLENAWTKKPRNIRDLIEKPVRLAVEYIAQNRNIITILFHETLLKASKTKIDIVDFINPLWDRIEADFRGKFPSMPAASLMDKLICVNLIINYVMIASRLDGMDQAAMRQAKDLYIKRVTRIITMLIAGHKAG